MNRMNCMLRSIITFNLSIDDIIAANSAMHMIKRASKRKNNMNGEIWFLTDFLEKWMITALPCIHFYCIQEGN